MATGKKSVLLYCDLIHTVEKLSNEDAGELFKHYLRYINDLDPITDNVMVDVIFESIKQNLKRDLQKWEARAERSKENGKLGGRPKKPKKPSGLNKNPTEPRKPDKVTVTDTVNDNVTVINKQIPAYLDFKNYALDKCSELNFNVSENQINAKYQSWKANNWRNGNGKQIKNWKSTLLNTLPYLNQKETIDKPETKEDKEAREFMEQLKKDSYNEILNPNDVQPNINDNTPPAIGGV